MTPIIQKQAESDNGTIEQIRATIRNQYKFLKDYPKIGPISAFLLMVSISVLDLCESACAVLPTLSENPEAELDFVSKTTSRILILRAYEQRKALNRFRIVIVKINEDDAFQISFEKFDKSCKDARRELDYIDSLKPLRDQIAHYNDDHLMIVELIEKIDVPALVNASSKLIGCYLEFLDIALKVQELKMKMSISLCS